MPVMLSVNSKRLSLLNLKDCKTIEPAHNSGSMKWEHSCKIERILASHLLYYFFRNGNNSS